MTTKWQVAKTAKPKAEDPKSANEVVPPHPKQSPLEGISDLLEKDLWPGHYNHLPIQSFCHLWRPGYRNNFASPVHPTPCCAMSWDHLPVLIDMTCPSFFHPPNCPDFRCIDWATFQAHLQDSILSYQELRDNRHMSLEIIWCNAGGFGRFHSQESPTWWPMAPDTGSCT